MPCLYPQNSFGPLPRLEGIKPGSHALRGNQGGSGKGVDPLGHFVRD